jgi:hypothetical protein
MYPPPPSYGATGGELARRVRFHGKGVVADATARLKSGAERRLDKVSSRRAEIFALPN